MNRDCFSQEKVVGNISRIVDFVLNKQRVMILAGMPDADPEHTAFRIMIGNQRHDMSVSTAEISERPWCVEQQICEFIAEVRK